MHEVAQPTSAAPPFVDLRQISVMREDTVVLHDIHLQIAAGECVAILGPNGCGKSTLIKLLTCEVYPLMQPGMHLRIFGRERWDVSELRRRMGLVTSELPVCHSSSVCGLEVVLSGFFSSARLWPHLQVSPEMRDRARQAMQDLSIANLAKRPFLAMSAGEQRRTVIARALAAGADAPGQRVLLLDEPMNALDLVAQRDLRAALSLLAQRGTSVILVTHHVQDIIPGIRRVLLMQHGSIVADGLTSDLLASDHLSRLFHAPIQVMRDEDGTYSAR